MSDVMVLWLPVRPRPLVLPSAWRRTPDAPGQSAAHRWHQTEGSSPSSGAPASSLFWCCKTATCFLSGFKDNLGMMENTGHMLSTGTTSSEQEHLESSTHAHFAKVSQRLPLIKKWINKMCSVAQSGMKTLQSKIPCRAPIVTPCWRSRRPVSKGFSNFSSLVPAMLSLPSALH